MVKTIISHPFENGLYHLFMVNLGMDYYCFTNIIAIAIAINLSELGRSTNRVQNRPNHRAQDKPVSVIKHGQLGKNRTSHGGAFLTFDGQIMLHSHCVPFWIGFQLFTIVDGYYSNFLPKYDIVCHLYHHVPVP